MIVGRPSVLNDNVLVFDVTEVAKACAQGLDPVSNGSQAAVPQEANTRHLARLLPKRGPRECHRAANKSNEPSPPH
jgi:hypothetical protein